MQRKNIPQTPVLVRFENIIKLKHFIDFTLIKRKRDADENDRSRNEKGRKLMALRALSRDTKSVAVRSGLATLRTSLCKHTTSFEAVFPLLTWLFHFYSSLNGKVVMKTAGKGEAIWNNFVFSQLRVPFITTAFFPSIALFSPAGSIFQPWGFQHGKIAGLTKQKPSAWQNLDQTHPREAKRELLSSDSRFPDVYIASLWFCCSLWELKFVQILGDVEVSALFNFTMFNRSTEKLSIV